MTAGVVNLCEGTLRADITAVVSVNVNIPTPWGTIHALNVDFDYGDTILGPSNGIDALKLLRKC